MNYIDKVREFVIEELLFGDSKKLNDETSFYDTGIIDSTGILELISFLEETFDITINDEDLVPENLENIKYIAQFIERKLNDEKHKINE